MMSLGGGRLGDAGIAPASKGQFQSNDRRGLSPLWRVAFFVMAAAFVVFVSTHEARAQISCAAGGGEDSNNLGQNAQVELSGSCGAPQFTSGGVFTDPTNAGLQPYARRFLLVLPDSTPNDGASNPAKIRFTDGTNLLTISSVSCPGATVGGVGTSVATIRLTGNSSCLITVGANGNDRGYTGTLTLTGSVYTISVGTLSGTGFGGTFTPVITVTTLTAQDRGKIADSLLNTFNNFNASVFDTDGASIFGNGQGTGVTFAPTGMTILSSRTGTGYSSPMSLTGDNPFDRTFDSLDLTPSGLRDRERSNNGFMFRFDLNEMARAKANGESVLGVDKNVPKESRSPFNAWVSGRYIDFKDKQTNADRDGHLWWVTGGFAYQMGPDTKVGAFGRVRQGAVSSVSLNSRLNSDFYGGGVFALHEFYGGLRVMAAASYELGNNSIVITGATGSFDSQQYSAELRIDKRFRFGPHWIEPMVQASYSRLDRDGYTDSAGFVIASSSTNLGRLQYGPKFGTSLGGLGEIKEIRPFAKVNGIWDFERAEATTLSSGVVLGSASTAINLGAGTELEFHNGIAVSVSGDWYGFNSEFSAWSVTGGVGAPLSAFGVTGLLPNGNLALYMTAQEQGMGARFRLTVTDGK